MLSASLSGYERPLWVVSGHSHQISARTKWLFRRCRNPGARNLNLGNGRVRLITQSGSDLNVRAAPRRELNRSADTT
jgi:hypothetical protein